MNDIVLHETTQIILDRLKTDLPQSLLLSGEVGIGLATITRSLGAGHLAVEIRPKNTKGDDDSSGTISVEMIRDLYAQTRAKHTAKQVIVIDDAERMSHGAQSAFLKLLEEPNEHIHFILTSHSPQRLLPTIRSRVQHLALQPVAPTQTIDFIASLGASAKQAQLQFIAAGLPAEIKRLIDDDAYFRSRAEIIGDARDFLQGTAYQKLLLLQKYRSDRTVALHFIDSLLTILRRSLSAKPQSTIVSQLEQLLEARERVAANHNFTLQMARLVV